MVRILISLFLIIGGLALVFLVLYDYKKMIKMNDKDNYVQKKGIYARQLLDLIRGFLFIVLGLILFLNLLTPEKVGLLSASILLLIAIIEFIINKIYKEIK